MEAYLVPSHFFVNWARARARLRRVIDSRGQKPVVVRTRFFRARPNTTEDSTAALPDASERKTPDSAWKNAKKRQMPIKKTPNNCHPCRF
jgi:hypothetical protein